MVRALMPGALAAALVACGTTESGASAAPSSGVASTVPTDASPVPSTAAAASAAMQNDGSAPAEPIAVAATTSILADLVTNVGGERVAVTALLPPGTDPHTFSPSPNEARAVADSQLLVENGAGLEEWLAELIENAGGERPTVVASDGVTGIEGFEHEQEEEGEHEDEGEHAEASGATGASDAADEHSDDEHVDESAAAEASGAAEEHADEEHAEGSIDPHMWFDPTNVITYAENIRDGLKQIDPDGAATYDANTASYIEQLRQLDTENEQQLAAIPAERRKLVTNHDTFGYFAARYDFDVVGTVFEGVSTEEEPSPQQVAQLVERIRDAGVPAIFAENTVNSRLAEQIADEAGVAVVTDLYTDALGKAGSEGDTYLKMMRWNVGQIVEALQ